MTKLQLLKSCELMKFEVDINQELIKENVYDYENYIQIQKINGTWEYSKVDFERKSPPEKVDLKTFNDRTTAYRYFFLNLLKSHAFDKAFMKDNSVYHISSLIQLEQLFAELDLPGEYYNLSETLNAEEIYVELSIDQKVTLHYINQDGIKAFSTRPLELKRGILSMYRITRYYCMLKETEKTLFDNQIINEAFSDEEVKWFIK